MESETPVERYKLNRDLNYNFKELTFEFDRKLSYTEVLETIKNQWTLEIKLINNEIDLKLQEIRLPLSNIGNIFKQRKRKLKDL